MVNRWTTIFAFVFRHHITSRGYKNTTVIVALLLLVLIPAVFCFFALTDDSANDVQNTISRALVINPDGAYVPASCSGVHMENCPDMDSAVALVGASRDTIIIEIADGAINMIIPDASDISDDDAQTLGNALSVFNAGVTAENDSGLEQALMPEDVPMEKAADAEDDDSEIREIVGMLVPYIMVMVIYFMVLVYSQGVANAVIMEKTSKLMDLFLISVRPASVILGKMLAVALAGIVQLVIWLAGVGGGIALGYVLTGRINPGMQIEISAFFDSMGGLFSVFDPAVIIMIIAMIITGFMLYCALSAIGGALASQPEELSSTNVLFTMALVVSFMACMFGGNGSGIISGDRWMNFIPFTAILVVPGRLITGVITPMEAVCSIGITAMSAFLLVLLAGKAYTMTAFYRGAPIKPLKFLGSLFKKQA